MTVTPTQPGAPGGGGRLVYPTLDAYGDGGFRLDGARHEGSVLVVNGQVMAWTVGDMRDVTVTLLDAVFAAEPRPELILLGAGPRMAHPPGDVLARCRETAVGLEVMDTPAACRVYATLVGEGRHIAAALIAV